MIRKLLANLKSKLFYLFATPELLLQYAINKLSIDPLSADGNRAIAILLGAWGERELAEERWARVSLFENKGVGRVWDKLLTRKFSSTAFNSLDKSDVGRNKGIALALAGDAAKATLASLRFIANAS